MVCTILSRMNPSSPMMPVSTGAILELKINELNRRLRHCADSKNHWWWDQFASEFFDDSAYIFLSYCTTDDGEKHFSRYLVATPKKLLLKINFAYNI